MDFGTGYSSLSYLQRFPINVLKIDKSFVDGIVRGGNQAALARTIISLGDSLVLRTVAEGIETDAQRSLLRDLGCQLGQGFLNPLAASAIPAVIGQLGLGEEPMLVIQKVLATSPARTTQRPAADCLATHRRRRSRSSARCRSARWHRTP